MVPWPSVIRAGKEDSRASDSRGGVVREDG